MTQIRILAVAALALVMLAANGMAQRRTGGAVSSGVRGAMVGGLVGGEGAAKKGAAIGAVAGATRTVTGRNTVNAEAQARAQYQSTAQYQDAQHSNFDEAPPEVLADGSAAADGKAAAPNKDGTPVETVLRKAGKPAVGITYPNDWKLKAQDRRASAVSADGQGWSVIALLDGVKDKEAGITKAKQGLEKSLKDIKYDEPSETERGALVVTGTGKGKKAGVEVVFAVGVFESGPKQLAGAAFVVDKDVEDHYKETVRSICETIRGEKDLAEAKEAGK
jgi:hypothetical protein